MKEDIKKDLEDLKKEVVKKENEMISNNKKDERFSEEERLAPERIEGLVEDLKEETQVEESLTSKTKAHKFKKLNFIKSPWMLGVFASIVLLILGMFVLYKLLFYQGKATSKEMSLQIALKEETKEVKQNQTLGEDRVKSNDTYLPPKAETVITKSEQKLANYPYKLELKNFVIPIGVKDFLNMDVVLYFDNHTTMRDIANSEVLYKEAIYQYFQGVSSVMWFDPNKRKELKEKLKEYIQNKKINPTPREIELEVVIFRG